MNEENQVTAENQASTSGKQDVSSDQSKQSVDQLVSEVSSLVEVLQRQQQQEKQQQEKQMVEEQKKEAEQQKKEDETTQKTIQLLEEQNKKMDVLVKSMSTQSTTLNDTTDVYQTIIQDLDEIKAKMDNSNQTVVEVGWMVVLSVVFAVGLKLFWDNVLKW